MIAETLLHHFDNISEAPDAVARLRSFVLDLAVRGRLVADDNSDNSDKMPFQRPAIDENLGGPFQIPQQWCWTTVGAVSTARLGKMLDRAKNTGAMRRYLRNTNVRWFDFDLSDVLEMQFEDHEVEEFTLRSGDVLICEGGEPGRCAVWDAREEGIFFQKAIHRVRFCSAVDPHYFVLALRNAADEGRLSDYFTGVGIKHLTGKGLASFRFPLPPLTTQRRIVGRVKELMALCDGLKAAQEQREARRDRIVASLLQSMTVTQDTADSSGSSRALRMSSQLYLHNLPQLTTRIEHVKQLRHTILELAVQGRLVAQSAGDVPVTAALKRAAPLERPARYASRSPEVIPGNCGLSIGNPRSTLPHGWEWIPLVEIARLESGHTPSRSRPDWWGGDIPWIGLVDARLHNGGVIHETIQHTNESGIANSAARVLPAGTVCFSRTASVGYVVIMGRPMATSQDFVNWVPTELIDSRWLQLVLTAEKPALGRFSKGAVHQTIYYPAWLSMHIALPPLSEQQRIIERVKTLTQLCDELETRLAKSADFKSKCLEASLQQSLRNCVSKRELQLTTDAR